ncbi:MAG: hypothetical protein C4348_01505, partial [Patescibacteria group bacterium]
AAVLAALQQAGVLPSTTTQSTTTQATATEAVLSVRLAAQPSGGVQIKEGQSADVLGVRVVNTGGYADVQRLRFVLTSNVNPTRLFSSFDLYDGSEKVASVPADAYSRIASNEYEYNFSGLNVRVPEKGEKTLVIRANVNNIVDSRDTGSLTVSVRSNDLRAVDGLGVQHTPSVSGNVSRSFTVAKATPVGAGLTVYAEQLPNTPRSQNYAADSNNQVNDILKLLTFNVRADNDTIKLNRVTTTVSLNNGTVRAVRLVDANGNVVASGDRVGGTDDWVFSSVDFATPLLTVNKDATVKLSVVADVDLPSNLATTTPATISATVSGVSGERSDGGVVIFSGSVSGKRMYLFRVAAAQWNVVSSSFTPVATATSTLTGTSTVQVTADRGDVYIPTSSAFTVVVARAGTTTTATATVVYNESIDRTADGNYYVVRRGDTGTFNLTAHLAAPSGGWEKDVYWLELRSMKWGVKSGDTVTLVTTEFEVDRALNTRTAQEYMPR